MRISDDEIAERLQALGVTRVEQAPDMRQHRTDFTFYFSGRRPPMTVRLDECTLTTAVDPIGLLVAYVEKQYRLYLHVGGVLGTPRHAHGPDHSGATPRRAGKALGFRSWKLDGYRLLSANPGTGDWKIGEPTEAACLRFIGHAAPDPDCECGLYALHSPEFASRWHSEDPLMVHGAVLGWGRMEVHGEGWRAQYAQPVMLAIDGERQPRNHCQRVQALASELGLPVVEWDEFEARARELGEPVPEDLRPALPSPAAGEFASGGMILSPGFQLTPPPPSQLVAPHFAAPNFTVAQFHAFAGVPAPKPRRRGIGRAAWIWIAGALVWLGPVVAVGQTWNLLGVGVSAGMATWCARVHRDKPE